MVRERVRDRYGDDFPSDDDKKQTSTKKKIENNKKAEDKKKEPPKRKIKQEDIDAAQPPPMVTHQVKNLSIDLTSNVVEMAKKSRKRTMKTHSPAIEKEENMKNKEDEQVKSKTMNENSSENESDEEEKKEKIRAILQWGTKGATSNPDLSDDSDREARTDDWSPSPISAASSNPYFSAVIQPTVDRHRKRKNNSGKLRGTRKSASESDDNELSSPSSRSTTPETVVNESDVGPRRTSHRSTKRKVQTYKESEGESSEDISVDESDCDDKAYDPQKEKKLAE